jgi:N-acetylglucosamine kinase-like BadF-type ATPase
MSKSSIATPRRNPSPEAPFFLGFDGGGTKTECALADASGRVVARATVGPSNPLRTGYTRAWFALSEAADSVLSRHRLRAGDIRGVCAGLGGTRRPGAARRVTAFFEESYPNARVKVTTDLEIAFEAAFNGDEGMILIAGTGSAAFGRDAKGRTARAGGRGPWFSDEGSAFDIGRRAVRAVALAEEHRGPATALSAEIFSTLQARDWNSLTERLAKNPDDVFPQVFPLVAELADQEDGVAREILLSAAADLAGLAQSVTNELGWRDRDFPIARMGGTQGRSHFFDGAMEAELKKRLPRSHAVTAKLAPADAAVEMAARLAAKGNAA